MKKLYIIGNGFDLWHNLPTRYSDFYRYSKSFLDDIERYYTFDTGDQPWHNFEDSLGLFEPSSFYDEYNMTDPRSESFKPSDMYGVEDDINENADRMIQSIREQFNEWIIGIDIKSASKKLNLPIDARYVNFNYTSTLQCIYDIDDKNILHIHGNANKNDDLIFGHDATMEEIPEVDESGDSNRTIFTDAQNAAKYPFYALKKPIDEVLTTHAEFFSALTDLDEINVIGHSLNHIDLPYFKKIASAARKAKWNIVIYSEQEKAHYHHALAECEICSTNISFYNYTDISKLHQ